MSRQSVNNQDGKQPSDVTRRNWLDEIAEDREVHIAAEAFLDLRSKYGVAIDKRNREFINAYIKSFFSVGTVVDMNFWRSLSALEEHLICGKF